MHMLLAPFLLLHKLFPVMHCCSCSAGVVRHLPHVCEQQNCISTLVSAPEDVPLLLHVECVWAVHQMCGNFKL
jgi:hypothetical protein